MTSPIQPLPATSPDVSAGVADPREARVGVRIGVPNSRETAVLVKSAAARRAAAPEKDAPATFAEFLAQSADDGKAMEPAGVPGKAPVPPKAIAAAELAHSIDSPTPPGAPRPELLPACDAPASTPTATVGAGPLTDVIPTLWVPPLDAAPSTVLAGGQDAAVATCEPGPCLEAPAANPVRDRRNLRGNKPRADAGPRGAEETTGSRARCSTRPVRSHRAQRPNQVRGSAPRERLRFARIRRRFRSRRPSRRTPSGIRSLITHPSSVA